jgi:hypothetical protein
MGTRMPVQQQDRRPGSAVADPKRRLADVDHAEGKAFEHGHWFSCPGGIQTRNFGIELHRCQT